MPRTVISLEEKQASMRERRRPTAALPPAWLSDTQDFKQHHYTAAEIAELWNLSPDAVRRIFEDEPGVLVLGRSSTGRGRRAYTTLRIPESVVERVYRRQLSR